MKSSIKKYRDVFIGILETGTYMVLLSGLFLLYSAGSVLGQQRHTAMTGTIKPNWVKYFGLGMDPANDHLEDLTTDQDGNTYITGWTTAKPYGTGYLTQKYDDKGKLVWQNLFNRSGTGDDQAKVIAVDQNGNVAVSGVAWDSVTAGYHITTVYYNSQGKQQWFTVIPDSITPPSNSTSWEVTAIAFDGGGNVYLAGSLPANELTNGGVTSDLLVAKFSDSGRLLWMKSYDGGMQLDDRATDLKVDHAGDAWVTGWSATGTGFYPPKDIITIKYNPDGTRQWEKSYGNGDDDQATAMVRDAQGNVYVTGSDMNPSNYFYTNNCLLIKYDKNGNQIWLKHPPAYYPYDMGIDKNGRILVTGAAYAAYGGREFMTIKYAENGDSLWSAVNTGYGGTGGRALTIDTAANVYVTGYQATNSIIQYDNITTLKYDSTGVLKWSKSQPSQYPNGYYAGSSASWPLKIAINSNDQVVVGETEYSQKSNQDMMVTSYSAAGDSLWGHNYTGNPTSFSSATKMVQDAAGNTYIVGSSTEPGALHGYFFVSKFNTEGKLVWVNHGNSQNASGLAVDANGNVYVCGSTINTNDFGTIKYNAQGDSIWTRTYNDPSGGVDLASDVTVDNNNNIIVTGESEGQNYATSLVTIKYDPDGNVVWTATNQILNSSVPYRVMSDASGDVYVTGTAKGSGSGDYDDFMIVKYNKSNGDTLWTLTHKNFMDSGSSGISITGMAVDANGNIYVEGNKNSLVSYSMIAKVNSSGDTLWTTKNPNADAWDVLTTDNKGNLFAAGSGYDVSSGTFLSSITKLGSDGSELWSETYPGAGITAITTDANGNAYVTGSSKDGYLTVEYQPDGTRQWVGGQYNPPGLSTGPIGIAIDTNNNVTIAGGISSTVLGNSWAMVNLLQYNQLATPIAKEPIPATPASFRLSQNYPNPFNPTTTIRYSLAQPAKVTLSVFNILGQKVATLVNRYQNAGAYSYIWKADRFASGMYLYRLKAGNVVQVKKMLLLK